MRGSTRVSVYDRLRPHLDAADLIARLGIEVSRVSGSEAYCRPLCHESTSGESLQINLHTGRWNCKACQPSGVYGDLIQLVEYVQTNGGVPSRGTLQGSSDGHRRSLAWLCSQFGEPFDEHRVSGDFGLDVVHMFAMAAHEHLLKTPRVLEWIQEKWGFDVGTVEAYGLGYMPDPILPEIAAEAARAESRAAFRASGLGWFDTGGSWRTRFAGRVTFPYLEHGRAVYLIGRATPWTPTIENGAPAPKYHKLSVHSDTRPYVSERITNDHLYNEPVMSSADEIGVLEGVADGVAISALGVSVVSPVTISFNAVDLERFLRKCHENGIARVWILFDNELSGSGNFAARRVGKQLVDGGLAVKILTLPLGDEQQRARDEVISALGPELFDELERSDPRRRKELIADSIQDETKRAWIMTQIQASKIDAAEWSAQQGAGAAGRFDKIRRLGVDVIDLEVKDVAVNPDDEPSDRASAFTSVIELAAHIDDRLSREACAGKIAAAAGKGVTKVEIARRIAAARRDVVKPKREKEKSKSSDRIERSDAASELILLPPENVHAKPTVPEAPRAPSRPGVPAAPPPPNADHVSDHERYAPARAAVSKAVDAKVLEERLGEYVAQTITRSMGFTPFRTPDELFLVRGSERVPVGLATVSPRFTNLLYLASGLTTKKTSHRAYIASAVYFLERGAQRTPDVSWSYVDPSSAIYFPTSDEIGTILKIEPGQVTRTKMSEARVPAVAGDEFGPIKFVPEDGGIQRVFEIFRWTSISESDRLVLIYWLVCLPLLRRVGTVPIVRIEGGSSSGKTRTVDAVSYLVNGRKSSSVPTAAALVSRMSTEMLTIDDNRETKDVSDQFLGTLLQATHLGAREKRRSNTDTGTVVERVCGALLMNGIEPIHDGRSELASRMLTLRCADTYRSPDSPTAEESLARAIVAVRDGFWSESIRRCSDALLLDRDHGDEIGVEIESIFGSTKIGRLSAYLRIMYLAWVAGLPANRRPVALERVSEVWRDAFASIASGALESLLAEELSVAVLRYVFAWADSQATPIYTGASERRALDNLYVADTDKGDAFLGPLRATRLARLARYAGKDMNAPRAIASDLRAGQLERRILDGLAFLEAAGFRVEIETTRAGRHRFTFCRETRQAPQPLPPNVNGSVNGTDTWVSP